MRQGLIDSVKIIASEELHEANKRFPEFNSTHEGYAIIMEERDELQSEIDFIKRELATWWEVVKNGDCDENDFMLAGIEESAINAACEAIQVSAMCKKFTKLFKQN